MRSLIPRSSSEAEEANVDCLPVHCSAATPDRPFASMTVSGFRWATSCLVCGEKEFKEVYGGRVINNHVLGKCALCGMVQAFTLDGIPSFDYSGYGDYLLLDDSEIRSRIRCASRGMYPISRTLRERFNDAVVLDFGSGAGYFCKAAEQYGFNAFGIELSDKLIEYSKTRVKFEKVFKRIEDIGVKFDAIFMSDVIEHLSPISSRRIMTNLIDHLKAGGLLIGNTPNFKSVNIFLSKERDPVVAPPSHICYFSRQTLERYLCSLGLARVRLYSRGLSSNGFLRRSKFERSFLEKSLRRTGLHLIPLWVLLRTTFKVGGLLVQPFGLGYQIYFMYKKLETSH